MMISHHRMGDNGNGPDRVIEYILTHKCHKRHRYQRHKRQDSGKRQRSRSRGTSTCTCTYFSDDESAAVEPQSRLSDRSMSPQRKESLQEQSPQKQKGKKTTAQVKKPSDLPKAKKHKPTDPDADDDEPQNEPGTSSNSQPPVPVLLSSQDRHPVDKVHRPVLLRPAHKDHRTSTSSEGESADDDDEKENLAQQCKVHEVRTQEGQCSTQTCRTVTPEAHMFAAAAG